MSSSLKLFAFVSIIVCAVAHADTVMVPMRDGVKLATDVHLPPTGGPKFPVVLVRTVYGRQDTSLARGLHKDGIALVVQDTRGHGDSEGKRSYFTTDGWGALQDGVETVNWLKAQPWCNGKIGTWGSSALGITSTLLAPATKDLAAQVIHVAPCDFYDSFMPGGVPQRALSETYAIVMGYEAEAAERRKHPSKDAYWKQFDARARAADITAPAFFVGGWFDLYTQGIIDGFMSRQYGGGPGARGNNMLVVGPWPHGGEQKAGEFTFPEMSKFPWTQLAQQYLRHWLLDERDHIMDMHRVHYYVLGDLSDPKSPGNEWRTANDWPPYPWREFKLSLSVDGKLVGERKFEDKVESGKREFVFDPANPCPTLGGPNVVISGGPRDQRPISSRSDVLKYVTKPLDEPLEFSGPVSVALWVSTDSPDTDFIVKLIDVYPDGREINLAEGSKRMKYRVSVEEPWGVQPFDVTRVDVSCQSISVVFNTGHRIGVLVSSSNYPRLELNPNNGTDRPEYKRIPVEKTAAPTLTNQLGADLPAGTAPSAIADQVLDTKSVRVAHNAVYIDPKRYPSVLKLPVRHVGGAPD